MDSIQLGNVEYIYDTAIMSDQHEPKTMRETLNREDAERWTEAAKNELHNFHSLDLWEFIPREETFKLGKTIIGCKWVFKLINKINVSKSYKVRIVLKDYMQVLGIDYTERC